MVRDLKSLGSLYQDHNLKQLKLVVSSASKLPLLTQISKL
jgi:hypothetical protein